MIEIIILYILIGCIIGLIFWIWDKFIPIPENLLTVQLVILIIGPAEINYKEKLVDALKSAELCVDKYRKTGNTEYLCDAANYLMFEFMYPQVPGAYFKATDSKDSAGLAGKPIGSLHEHFL